ncbi:Tubulin epsilon chain [Trachymyrmex zeteki]|uniref:Tubulin epsilon chain n=1 Tax=Mycetomoellerius zeteki TaxID=64791 RepID=A0A151WUE1_9HYME|nr:Tubulin epsilon chain [Trachymyrmex zeteki]
METTLTLKINCISYFLFFNVLVGQCGNQIGSAFWPLVLHEYGIQTTTGDVTDLNAAKIKARAVLVDMEDSVLSRFKQGPLRQLFDQTCIVTNYPGSGNNWYGSRFPGSLNMDMNEIATNLVPYPKLHYIFSSINPVTLSAPNILQDEVFTNAWSRNNQLIRLDPLQSTSVILAAAHIARGNTTLTDIKRNIERFQNKSKFTSWSRDCMKIGLCSIPPAGHSSSLLCLLNSSAMSSLFKDIIREFSKLYKKKAHVHHYTQVHGFEETHFIESKENILSLCDCYAEIQNMEETSISRLQVI